MDDGYYETRCVFSTDHSLLMDVLHLSLQPTVRRSHIRGSGNILDNMPQRHLRYGVCMDSNVDCVVLITANVIDCAASGVNVRWLRGGHRSNLEGNLWSRGGPSFRSGRGWTVRSVGTIELDSRAGLKRLIDVGRQRGPRRIGWEVRYRNQPFEANPSSPFQPLFVHKRVGHQFCW